MKHGKPEKISSLRKKQTASERDRKRRKVERCKTLLGDYFLKQAIWSEQMRADLLAWVETLPKQEQELFETVSWLHEPDQDHQHDEEPPLGFVSRSMRIQPPARVKAGDQKS